VETSRADVLLSPAEDGKTSKPSLNGNLRETEALSQSHDALFGFPGLGVSVLGEFISCLSLSAVAFGVGI
jgi:hypothetical protein